MTVEIADAELHRSWATRLFNEVWRMMELEDREPAEDAFMLHQAHASLYHWLRIGGAARAARGEWLCSRVYALLRRPEPARYHAERTLDICQLNGIGDWDLGYAYEALARASAIAGDGAATREWLARARSAAAQIAAEDDRELLFDDLATVEAFLSYPRG